MEEKVLQELLKLISQTTKAFQEHGASAEEFRALAELTQVTFRAINETK